MGGRAAGVARKKGDRFEAVSLGVARGVAGREGIASDAAGHLYFATERGLVTGSNGSPYKLIAAPRGEASSVYVDGTGAVWFGCGSNLCRFENGEAREIGSEEGLPGDGWDAILGDRQGNLWVRSERSLYMRANGSRRFEPARAGLPESTNTYPTLALDPAGRLLVPTYRGLARQTGKGWEILEAQQGLTTNDISAVMQDREGSIWLGLLGSGLARWLGYNEWQGWSDREGLSRESIWSIARDASGRLWVGTQFGLNYADDHGERLEWRKQALEGVEMIRSLAAGSKDALWIGAWPGGLRWLNTRTGETRSIGSSQGLSSNYVRHVMVDREERVWVSTRDGLFRAAAGSMKFDSVIPGETFHMTMMDRTGAVWAAGAKGLMRFAGEQVTRFDSHSGLKSDVVAHLAEDPDGSLWIGYYDAFGLTRLTFLHGGATFKHFTTPDGLRSDKSLFLGFDARGWLWAGSDHGVDVFDRTRWRHYGRSDGMIWDDCNTNGFMADADGGVWVGTSRGLSHFRPASAEPVSVPPPVVFTSVKFGDQSVEPASAGEIPYKRNSLQVRYAALTFAQESSVLFRYRLAGVQRNWTETTHRELDFPKLPAGQFTLEVMARNKQGTWTVAPARLDFQILTPWFLTWWFQMGNVLLALALGVGMWHRRTRRLEEERQRLEAAVTERTRELSLEKQRVVDEKARTEQQKVEIERLLTEAQQASRSKSEFLANMSHEIRTPMNGILGMTDMALAMPLLDEQREYLETARLSAKSLLTVLNDALDFSKIEAGHMELSPVNFSLRRCVHETAKMFSVAAAEKKLSLDVRFDESVPDHVIGDPDRLRQVLLNLLGNAMKFTADGGVLIVVERDKCEGDELLVHFAVADTGIGIPRDKQELIFEAFRQADGSTTRKYGGTGLGLAICLRLIHLMGGTVRVESEPDQGSTFHFTAKFVVVREPAGDVARPIRSAYRIC